MRECQNCHKEVRYVIQVFDTSMEPPVEYDYFPIRMEWCLKCIHNTAIELGQLNTDQQRKKLGIARKMDSVF